MQAIQNSIKNNWKKILGKEFSKSYIFSLRNFLKNEYLQYKVYPKKKNIFRALQLIDYNEVKVVIL